MKLELRKPRKVIIFSSVVFALLVFSFFASFGYKGHQFFASGFWTPVFRNIALIPALLAQWVGRNSSELCRATGLLDYSRPFNYFCDEVYFLGAYVFFSFLIAFFPLLPIIRKLRISKKVQNRLRIVGGIIAIVSFFEPVGFGAVEVKSAPNGTLIAPVFHFMSSSGWVSLLFGILLVFYKRFKIYRIIKLRLLLLFGGILVFTLPSYLSLDYIPRLLDLIHKVESRVYSYDFEGGPFLLLPLSYYVAIAGIFLGHFSIVRRLVVEDKTKIK